MAESHEARTDLDQHLRISAGKCGSTLETVRGLAAATESFQCPGMVEGILRGIGAGAQGLFQQCRGGFVPALLHQDRTQAIGCVVVIAILREQRLVNLGGCL